MEIKYHELFWDQICLDSSSYKAGIHMSPLY